MIIQCEKCQKKFRVADEKVPAKGAKVRCPNCKHVFVVKKKVEEEKLEEKAFFSLDVEKEVIPPEPVKTREEMAFKPPEESDQKAVKEPYIEIPREIAIEEEREKTLETERHFIEESHAKAEEIKAPPIQPPIEEEAPAAEDLRKKIPVIKRERRVHPLLLILFIITLIFAAVYFLIGYTQITLPIRFFSATQKPLSYLKISDISGFFVNNQKAGRLFVISGKVINGSDAPQSFLRVKGSLFDAAGKKVSENEVFCGNIFSREELITLEREFIEQRLSNQIGSSLSNLNILPGKSIDFNIVFFQPPERISEYAVEVAGAQAGTR